VNHAGEVEYDYDNSVEIHKRRGREPVVVSFERDEVMEQQLQSATNNGYRGSMYQSGGDDDESGSKASERTEVALYNGKTNSNGPDLCCAAGESLMSLQPESDTAPLPKEQQLGRTTSEKEQEGGDRIYSIEPVHPDLAFDHYSEEERTSQSSRSLHYARGMGPIRDVDDVNDVEKESFNKSYIWIALICFTIAGFIGGLVILLTRNDQTESQTISSITGNNSTSNNNTDGNNPSMNTTASNNKNNTGSNITSTVETISERERMIRDLLVDTSTDLLSDDSTPQAKALQWISYDDTASLPSENEEEIRARFALACLYFATNGPEWTNNLGFLSSDPICNWNDGGTMGVFCGEDSLYPVEVNIGKSISAFHVPFCIFLPVHTSSMLLAFPYLVNDLYSMHNTHLMCYTTYFSRK
jgi:hypothetical protein